MIGMYNSAISDAGGDAVPRRGGLATLLRASRSSVCAMLAAASSLSWATQLPQGAHLVEVIEPPQQGQAKSSLSPNQVELTGNIAVLELDADYDAALPDGQANVAVRRDVAQAVLAQGQAGPDDRYDFIVVFTDFPVDLGDGVAGLNWSVRNDVSGIGRPIYDNSAAFGSSRLQSYVDMRNALSTPVAAGSAEEDQVLDTLMHELMHQWGSHLRIEAPGLPAEALLGRNQSHWSALLSTDASVMYGARWQLLPGGRARSIGVREHYGPLDLYAAGWLALDEVPEFQLLQSTELAADALPQLGLEIAATAIPLNIGQVIAANGPRNPDSFSSQKHFRAALVLLRRSGSPLSSQQLDRLEAFRLRAQDRFAAITLGRASLLLGFEVAPAQGQTPSERAATQTCGGAGQPACESGVTGARDWLLATQRADGSWADKPQTAVRDSLAAVEALLAMSPEGSPEIDQALAWLEAAQPADVEQQILLFGSGLVSLAREAELAELIASTRTGVLRPSFGAQGSRQPSTMESAQVLLASVRRQARGGQALAETSALVDFLLERLQPNPATNPPADAQRCWSRESRGPCDALAAAAALEGLLAAGLSPADMADYRGVLLGFEADPLGVNVAQSLRLLHALGLSDDPRSQVLDQQLRAAQRPNGSWADSATATAESILWLLSRNLPDLLVSSGLQWGSDETFAGLPLRLQFSISNAGGVEADPVRALLEIRAEAAPDHAPWQIIGELMTPPLPVAASSAMQFDWDTSGVLHGSYRLRLSLDSERTLTELNELNNHDERVIDLAERPTGSDLLILPGAMVSPQVLDRVPLTVSVRADVMNLGQSDAAESVARVYALRFGELLPLAEQSIALAAGERQLLQIDAVIADPDVSAVRLVLDAEQSVVESNEGNNSVDLALLSEPAVDLEVRAEDLSVGPVGVEQGQALVLDAIIHNRGLQLSPPARIRLRVRTQGGEERILADQDIQIAAGQSLLRRYSWTADRAGIVELIVDLDPSNQVSELHEDNNEASIAIEVLPSTLPNLVILDGSVMLLPAPLPAGTIGQARATVGNPSSAAAAQSELAFYLQDPNLPDTTPWALVVVPALEPGEEVVVEVEVPELVDGGTKTLYVHVDPTNSIPEGNEEDNEALGSFRVLSLPDLQLISAGLQSVPSQPAPGAGAVLQVRVVNAGELPASGVEVDLRFGEGGAAGQASPTQVIAELAAGSAQLLEFPYTRPVDGAAFELQADVDIRGLIRESNEANNVAGLMIGDIDPDLYLTEAYISPNGDGIKDSTEIVARFDSQTDLRLRIISSWGEEVRRFEGGALNQTSELGVTWDGRRQDGRRALDDRYEVLIEDGHGEILAALSVVVDTNRSPIVEAATQGLQRIIPLSCPFSTIATGTPTLGGLVDRNAQLLYAVASRAGSLSPAIFSVPLNGERPEQLATAFELAGGQANVEQTVWVREGEVMLVVLNPFASAEHRLIEFDLRTRAWRPVLTAPGQISVVTILDEDWVVYAENVSGTTTVNTISLAGGQTRQLYGTALEAPLTVGRRSLIARASEQNQGQVNTFLVEVHLDRPSRKILDLSPLEVAFNDQSNSSGVYLPSMARFIIASGRRVGSELNLPHADRVLQIDEITGEIRELMLNPAGAPWKLYGLTSNPINEDWYRLESSPLRLVRYNVDGDQLWELDLDYLVDDIAWDEDHDPNQIISFIRNPVWSDDGQLLVQLQTGLFSGFKFWEPHRVQHLTIDPISAAVRILQDDSEPFRAQDFNAQWLRGELQTLVTETGYALERGSARNSLKPENVSFEPFPWLEQPVPDGVLVNLNNADPAADCRTEGTVVLVSAANGLASLDPQYADGAGAFYLVGTALDLNFSHYRLRSREVGSTTEFELATGRDPVDDEVMAIWSPASPGRYEILLDVVDLAGNEKTYRQTVDWFEQSAIGAVSLDQRYFSPNGDGVKDYVQVHYEILSPANVNIEVRNDQGQIIRNAQRTHAAPGQQTWLWDGTDSTSARVADGAYTLSINQRQLRTTVDTSLPTVEVNTYGDRFCDNSPLTEIGSRELPLNPANIEWVTHEPNWRMLELQRRPRGVGGGWSSVSGTLVPVSQLARYRSFRPVSHWDAYEYRIRAEDLAGNATIHPFGRTGIVITSYRVDGLDWGSRSTVALLSLCSGAVFGNLAFGPDRGWLLESAVVEALTPYPGGLPSGSRLTFEYIDAAGSDTAVVADVDIYFETTVFRLVEGASLTGISTSEDEQSGGSSENRCATQFGRIGFIDLPHPGVPPGATAVVLLRRATEPAYSPAETPPDRAIRLDPTPIVPPCGENNVPPTSACPNLGPFCNLVGQSRIKINRCTAAFGSAPIEHSVLVTNPVTGVQLQLLPVPDPDPSVLVFDISEFPIGDLLATNRIEEQVDFDPTVPFIGYDVTETPVVFGRDGDAPPALHWDSPLPGEHVCLAGSRMHLGLEVDDDFLFQLQARVRPEGSDYFNDKLLRIPRTLYPIYGEGMSSVSPILVDGPEVDLPLIWEDAQSLQRLGDGDRFEVAVAAQNCQVAVEERRFVTIDSKVRVGEFGVQVPLLGGPPYLQPRPNLDRRLRLSFAPAMSQMAVFRHVAAEATSGVVHINPAVPLLDVHGRIYAWTGDGDSVLEQDQAVAPPGLRSLAWDGRAADGSLVADGPYALTWTLEDRCGHLVVSEPQLVEVDNTPPQVVIGPPFENEEVQLLQPVVVEFADRWPARLVLDFRAEGSQSWTPIADDVLSVETTQWSGTWLSDLPAGRYELRARVVDRHGWEGQAAVSVNVPMRLDPLRSAVLMPELISPNGDLVLDQTEIEMRFNGAVLVDLFVESRQGTVLRTLLLGAQATNFLSVDWDGTDDAGVVLDDGEYSIRLRAVSASEPSNFSEALLGVAVDATAPVLNLVEPLNGHARGDGQLLVRIEDAHPLRWEASTQSAIPNLIAEGESFGLQPILSWQGVDEGTHVIQVRAHDAAGNESTSDFSILLDVTAPVVVISQPAAATLVTRGEFGVEVMGAVSDEHLSDWHLEAFPEGTPADVEVLNSGSGSMSGTLAIWPATAPDGRYQLRLSATDLAGNEAEYDVGIELDNSPPSVHIDAPVAAQWLSSSFDIRGSVDDVHLDEYVLEIAPRAPGTLDWQQLAIGDQPRVQALLASVLAPDPDGSYVLRLRATDEVGLTTSAYVDVEIDSDVPLSPPGLVATREGTRNARLNWSPSASTDVVAYRVLRNSQVIGVVASTSTIDVDLADGVHRYHVLALDRAGNESGPSNQASVSIDTTPPDVRIYRPLAGSRNRANIEIAGRAYSREDFERYRLSLSDAAQPGMAVVLVESGSPIANGPLAEWDSRSHADGDYGLLLEAWDYSQNRAETTVYFTVDNTPPAAPVAVVASVDDTAVDLSWQPNSESDLAGYLVYRGPVLLNGSSNSDPRGIAFTTASHRVENLGDGSHDFRVLAVDTTGNLSEPSAPADAELSGHPPRVTLMRPTPGTVFELPVLTRGSTTDQDIVEVLLQYRLEGTGTWINFGLPYTEPPYERSFLPPDLAYGHYQLRALATDNEGLTDPDPPSVAVEYRDLTAPDAPLALAASVDGGTVDLSWAAPQASDVDRYQIERQPLPQGSWQLIGEVPVPQLSLLDEGLADGRYLYRVLALDGFDNASPPSATVEVRIYTPHLQQPYAPGNQPAVLLTARSPVAGQAELERIASNGSEPLSAPMLAADVEVQLPVNLLRGLNEFHLRVVDTAGNRSKAATVVGGYDADPVAPSGLSLQVSDHDVSLQWSANPEDSIRGYRLFRAGASVLADVIEYPVDVRVYTTGGFAYSEPVLFDGDPGTISAEFLSSERDRYFEAELAADALIVAMQLHGLPNWDATHIVRLDGYWQDRWIELPASVERSGDSVRVIPQQPYVASRIRVALRSATDFADLPIGEINLRVRPLFDNTSHVETMADGAYLYRVSAVNDYGFEGPRSDAVEAQVGDAQPPDAVVLSGGQIEADVSLSWTASTAPDLAAYRLYRRGQLLFETTDLDQRSYLDAALANGVYDYQLFAVDQVGNAAGSNVLVYTITGTLPATPLNLSVQPVDGGGALRLHWSPGMGASATQYQIGRSLQPSGPFQPLAQVPATPTEYTDAGLQNGTRYYYVVAALDARGNRSADSNVANGVPFANQRLATPVFEYPTQHDQSLTLPGPATTLAGTAEADSGLLIGYRDEVLPLLMLPADPEQIGVGYGAERMAFGVDGAWAWLDFGYSAFLQPLDPDGGEQIELGQSCARAHWLTADELLHCDGQTSPERLLRIAADNPAQSQLYLSQPGIRGFALSTDSRQLLLLASFDWPDGSRESLALRSDGGPFVELPVDTGDIDADLLQIDPTGRWVLLRRLSDERLLLMTLASGVVVETDLVLAQRTAAAFHPDLSIAVLAAAGPMGQGIYQLDLQSAQLEWLDLGLAYPTGTGFSPDGGFLDVLGSDQWRRHRWPQLTLQQTLDVYEAERLQALGTGEAMLSTADGYGQLSWLRPAGVFRVDGVPLAPGENLMTALSTRPGQLNSFPALPITILVPTDGLPDLEVRASDLSLLPNQVRPGDQPRLGARVRNLGSGPSAQASANLVLSTPAGGLTQPPRVVPPLQPGDETLLVWQLPALDLAGPYLALVQLDPAGELVERSTANNRAQLGFAVSADGAPELQLSAQPTLLAPTQRLNGEVQILPGGLALNGRLRVRVVSPAGQLVAGLIDQPVSVPAVGSLPAQALQWTPGTIAAGDYLLQASLLDLQGSLRAQQVLPLSVTAFRTLTMSSSARVASVPSGMPIHLDTQLHFVAGNAAIEDPVLRARLETVEGDVLAEAEQALPTLLPGYSGSLESLLLPDPAAPAGQYLLRAELWTQGLLAESAAVQLITEPTASPLLEGSLAVPAVPLPIGEPVNIAWQVRNTGDVALNGIPLRATLRRSLQAAPLATLEQSIDLAIGAEWNGQLVVPAHLLALGDQLVSLSVIDGPQAGVLAFGSFRVVDALAPALSVVAPSPGSIVPARFRLDVRATDQHHPVAAVRVQRSGQAWLPMTPGVDFAGHHQRLLGPLADGPLSLQLDAEDAVGNRVEIGPVVYTVDATAPLVQISGVEDGGLYNGARTPQVAITELHPASEQILLNGQPYVSGTPVSSEDQYTLYVLARDAAGNEGSAIVSFELDLTPPPVAFSAPAAGSVIATPTTQVLVSSEPLAQVMLTPATGGSLQAQADAQGVASFSDVPLLEGSNLLLATASDAAGNISAPAELQLTRSAATINAVQGSLALAAVFEPPAAIAGGWQLQNLTTLDLSALPLRIELRQAQGGALLAQQALTVDLLPSGALQADFSFSSDGRALGTYAIALLAQLRDEQSQQIWIELAQESVELADLTAPSLQWLAPQADQLVGAEPELRASVTDTLSGVDRVELMLDGQPAGLLAQDDLQPDQYLAQPGPLDDGPYLAALQAFDLAGNTVASERAFVVDATPPLIQIDGVADDQLSNQPLSPQVSIIEPHLASSEILLDGQPYLSGTPVTGEGAHLLSVSAVDQLGNSASRQISFTLDFTPPALAFLSPPDGLEIIAAHLPAELQSEPQALVELRAGANQQTASTAADGRAQFAAVPLQLGPNTLLASATDAAGNRSPEVGVTVIRVRPTQAVIEGFLTLLSTTVNHGEPLQGGFQIGNGGGFDPGPVTILVRIHSGSTLLHELSWPQLLPPSAIASEAFSLPSDDWPLGTLRMELRWRAEDEPDATPVLIDQRLLIVRDGTAPLVAILDPPDGTVVGSAPQILASASDTLSEIAEASVRVNGGPWQAMAPAGQPDQYQASPFLPLIGYNLIEVRATDSAQNIGFAAPIILCRSSSLGEPGDGLFSGLFEGQDQLFADSFEGSECDPPPLLRRALRWAQPTAAAAAEGAR